MRLRKSERSSTRISALIVPQHNALPVLAGSMLQANGGAAMQVRSPVFTDVFAAKIDSAQPQAGDLATDAANTLVRRAGAQVLLAMVTRGTSLTIAGKRLLTSTLPANLAWRSSAAGAVTVEAEPAYKAAGGIDTLGIGGLSAGNNYGVLVDGA